MKKYYVGLRGRTQKVLIEAENTLSDQDVQSFINKLNIYTTYSRSDYMLSVTRVPNELNIEEIDISQFTHVYSITNKSLEELDFLIAVSNLRKRQITKLQELTNLEEQKFRSSLIKI